MILFLLLGCAVSTAPRMAYSAIPGKLTVACFICYCNLFLKPPEGPVWDRLIIGICRHSTGILFYFLSSPVRSQSTDLSNSRLMVSRIVAPASTSPRSSKEKYP